MLPAISTGGVLSPPSDLEPNLTVAWLVLWFVGAGTVLALAHAVVDWRATRSPMLWLLLLGGATVGPFAIEPTYDIAMATWYPADLPLQLVTVLGRPMSLMIPLMYISGISWTCYLAFRMVRAGASVRTMWLVFGTLSVIEGIGEMTLSQLDVMRYYGNLATIFDVPVPTLVQNAGMFPIIGVVLAALVPHLHGWRWIAVPLVPYCVYIGYVLGCTWPNFLAIHGQVSPLPFWLLALLSSALNFAAAWAALHSPTAAAYRTASADRAPAQAVLA